MDSYSEMERRSAGRKLAKARGTVDEMLRVAKVMAISAAAEGTQETVIASELGVDRMTVRKWIGKR